MMFNNCGCCWNCNSNCCGRWNNGCRATPIVAPRKVCTSCSNQYVEQPIICPIECRHIRNIVYYPCYYPRYEHTCMMQSNGNPFVNQNNSMSNNMNGQNGMFNTSNAFNGTNGCGCNR